MREKISEKVIVFGEILEIKLCDRCNGSGNLIDWSRAKQEHFENKNYPCEKCLGSRYIVVSHWKKE